MQSFKCKVVTSMIIAGAMGGAIGAFVSYDGSFDISTGINAGIGVFFGGVTVSFFTVCCVALDRLVEIRRYCSKTILSICCPDRTGETRLLMENVNQLKQLKNSIINENDKMLKLCQRKDDKRQIEEMNSLIKKAKQHQKWMEKRQNEVTKLSNDAISTLDYNDDASNSELSFCSAYLNMLKKDDDEGREENQEKRVNTFSANH